MGFKSLARTLLTCVLSRHGYELKEVERPLRNARAFFEWCSSRGFMPRTIVDVGAADGTPWLYQSLPNAYLVLIEPNEGFRDHLERLLASRAGELHFFGVGNEVGTIPFTINQVNPTSSSVLELDQQYR